MEAGEEGEAGAVEGARQDRGAPRPGRVGAVPAPLGYPLLYGPGRRHRRGCWGGRGRASPTTSPGAGCRCACSTGRRSRAPAAPDGPPAVSAPSSGPPSMSPSRCSRATSSATSPDEVGLDPGYRPHGYLFLAQTGAGLEVLRNALAVQHANGCPRHAR
jgi:hypothetical protein